MKRWGMLLLAGALALAVLAGCGSDGEDETALTKAQFTKQAESICTQAQKQKDELLAKAVQESAKKAKDVPPGKRQEEVVRALLRPFEKMTEELDELSPPEGDEEQVDAIVASFDSTVAELEEQPKKALGAGGSPFAKPDELANDYGLDACSVL